MARLTRFLQLEASRMLWGDLHGNLSVIDPLALLPFPRSWRFREDPDLNLPRLRGRGVPTGRKPCVSWLATIGSPDGSSTSGPHPTSPSQYRPASCTGDFPGSRIDEASLLEIAGEMTARDIGTVIGSAAEHADSPVPRTDRIKPVIGAGMHGEVWSWRAGANNHLADINAVSHGQPSAVETSACPFCAGNISFVTGLQTRPQTVSPCRRSAMVTV